MPGFVAPPEWYWKVCPYCKKPLGRIEIMKRKMKKVCTCRNCKKILDERNIHW